MLEEDAVVGALLLLEGAEELVEVVERRLDALLLGGREGRRQFPFLCSELALMQISLTKGAIHKGHHTWRRGRE